MGKILKFRCSVVLNLYTCIDCFIREPKYTKGMFTLLRIFLYIPAVKPRQEWSDESITDCLLKFGNYYRTVYVSCISKRYFIAS